MAASYLRNRRTRIAAAAGAFALVAVVVASVVLTLGARGPLSGMASSSPSPSPSPAPSEVVFGGSGTAGSVDPSPLASATPSARPLTRITPAPGTHLPPFPTPTTGPNQGVSTPPATTPRPVTVTIVAAGDIACDPAHNVGAPANCDQAATAAQIGQLHPTAVLTLGDSQYENGTATGYKSVYGPTWGQYRSITYPAIGNHEYLTSGASGYFGYFGVPAYYSYNLGNWHMVSLDSECSQVGGCGPGSRQEAWLLADLAANPSPCTMAYWHEPRWSSGEHGNATQMTTIWNDLVAAKVDLVLAGHNHDYERFVPLNATGQPDPLGTTEFVVGTGGKNHYGFAMASLPGEVVRNETSFGVIDMTLGPTSYSWKFVPAPGYTFTDSGSANCH